MFPTMWSSNWGVGAIYSVPMPNNRAQSKSESGHEVAAKTTEPQPADPQIDHSRRTLLSYWWLLPILGTVGTFGYMAHYARTVTFGKTQPAAPRYQSGPRQKLLAAAQLTGPNSAHEFEYLGTPCILLEIAQSTSSSLSLGGRHFAAFSRLCTHQGCRVNLVSDKELLALSYNYRAEHAMLGCPCHYSVFDPQQEGASVFGRALYPLPRVQLSTQAGLLYALGLESDPRVAAKSV